MATSGERVLAMLRNKPDAGGADLSPVRDLPPPDEDAPPRLFPYPIARTILARFYAFIAMLIGLTIASGWLAAAEPLLRMFPDTVLMSFNTAILMALTGLCLGLRKSPVTAHVRRVVGAVVMIWATLLVLQQFCSVQLGLDWPTIHGRITGGGKVTGFVSPATCIGFFLIGYVLQRLDDPFTQEVAARVKLAIAGVMLMCTLGFAGYFLDLNLLYSWYESNRMALSTSIGMTLLSWSLLSSYHANDWTGAQRPHRAGGRIVTIGTALLLIMGMAAGLTGFVMFFNYQKTAVASQLQGAAATRAMVVESTIADALGHSRYALTRTHLVESVRRAAAVPDDRQAQAALSTGITSLIGEGFSSVTVSTPGDQVLAAAGKRVTQPDTAMALQTDLVARLMWASGFVIEVAIPVMGTNGNTVAMVEAQRRFHSLAGFFTDVSVIGTSADTALCGRPTATSTGCFPTYQIRRPQEFIARDQRGRLAIDDALDGVTAVRIARDYRDEQVVAAYTPVGEYGLAMILKLDAEDLFSPIRNLLERTLLTLLVLSLIGAYILRKLIRPMVRRIIESERRARDANALAIEREMRTRTVVDHVFDGIITMNANGVILTCNPAACGMFGYSPDQLSGQHFSILLPKRHRHAARAFFTEYQNPDYPSSLKTHMLKLRGARQGGSEFHFELGTNEVTLSGQKGYVGIIHDVTENFEARRALAKSEKMLRTITNNLPALVGYVDKHEQVRFANKTYELWFQKPLKEIIGHSLQSLQGAAYEETRCYVEQALNGEPAKFEQKTIDAEGAATYSLTTYIPDLSNNGAVMGFYVLASDITERKNHEEALRHLAYHDTLTDLPNRRLFHDRLDQAMARSMRRRTMVALFYLDVDHFKSINDTLGHDNGDLLLQEFARRLTQCVRASDTVARMGGDEFTVLMEDIALAADADAVAVKILEAVRKPVMLGHVCIQVSTSIGVALYNGETVTQDRLIKVSDDALYQSKQNGRDRHSLLYVASHEESTENGQLGLLDALDAPSFPVPNPHTIQP